MTLPPARHRSRPNSIKADRPEGDSKVGRGAVLQFSPTAEAAMKSANSQQIEDPFNDAFLQTQTELAVVQPPYNLQALQNLPHENSMLRQCIEAMVTNVEGHGWRLEYVGPEGEEESAVAVAEKSRLEGFLLQPNPDMSFDETRARIRRDLETTGNGFFEAMRNEQREVVSVAHVPVSTIRMTRKDTTAIPVEVFIDNPDGSSRKITMFKKFRRFVQRVGDKVVYFKEFGDPRDISAKTGHPPQEGEAIPPEELATEVYHVGIYAPGSPYGVPRWINQLPSILGSRQAELTNLDFFRENAIPALAVLVSGGRLTQGSVEEIETHISGARGRQSMNRVLVLEAKGDTNAASEDGIIPPPRVDFKPLAGERQKDGFFLEYGADCDKKIRSAFRLPPIFVGQSEDYSHATAKASYEVAESQVFGPARRSTDDIFNTHVLKTYKPKFWELRSNPPKITDPEEVIKALEAFNKMGAMSPNQVIDIANEYFDLELPRIEEDWGDYPFDLVKSLAAKGQLAGLDAIIKESDDPNLDISNMVGLAAPAGGNQSGKPAVDANGQPTGGAGSTDNRAKVLAESFKTMRYAITGVAMQTAAEGVEEEEAEPETVKVEVEA